MKLGQFDLRAVSGGRFRLDGGGMFGIIPRVLWERRCPPDERNRIALDTNCALLRAGEALVLIDAGNGDKLSAKDQSIFALAEGDHIAANLRAAGIQPADITHVVFTHLHLDHAGGATREESGIVPTFPQARHFVQRGEFEDAVANRSHMRTSYRVENFVPLQEAGMLELLDGEAEILPGIRVVVTGGHTPHHQAVLIESEGRTAFYAGDLCPTGSHLSPPYNMAYDLDPLTSLRVKAEYLERAAAEGWLWLFDHDPQMPAARIFPGPRGYLAQPAE